jgi:chromosome segregation ATPase
MPAEIVRKQTPEEAELSRKREELAAVRATLAERELELADLRAQLKSFEGRYLRQVGVLYAELDEWEARIAELEAKLNPSHATKQQAQQARERATETHEATHGEASKAEDFQPSPDLKSLFREVAKRIHPDFAKDDADRAHRTHLMAQVNEAYSHGDAESLQRILDDYDASSESVQGEGIGAELIRIIRQIDHARKNVEQIDLEVGKLRNTEIAQLMQDALLAQEEGRDLLVELEVRINSKISVAQKRHHTLDGAINGRV